MRGAYGGLMRSAGPVVVTPGPAKELDFLEMILHVQADTEKLDVVGADSARYRAAFRSVRRFGRVTP